RKQAVLGGWIGSREGIVLDPQSGVAERPGRRGDRDLRTEGRQIGKPVVDHARGHRVVEHAETTAEAVLAILGQGIGHSNPASEVLERAGRSAGRHTRITGEAESGGRIGEYL